MPPLICTQAPNFRIDYGLPIAAGKSTDYRSTTGTYHRYMPNIPQDFDCRVKPRIKPGLLDKDVALRDEQCKTVSSDEYHFKLSRQTPAEKCFRPSRAESISYVRNTQEKIYAKPPPPRPPRLSEMKKEFQMQFSVPDQQLVYPPAVTDMCDIKGLCRDEQPPVRQEKKGYWKLLDSYLTTNRAAFIYDETEVTNDLYTGSKANAQTPAQKESGNQTIFDKIVFKNVLPNRILPRSWKKVPHMSMVTEYADHYLPHTFSQFYPYISDTSAVFCETLGVSGPWQNLCPPEMYFSEYSNISRGKSVRSSINAGESKQKVAHKSCNTKI